MSKKKSKTRRKAPTAKQRANWARFAREARARAKAAKRGKAPKKKSPPRPKTRASSSPRKSRSAPVAGKKKTRKRSVGSRKAPRRSRRRGGLSSLGRGFVPSGTVEAIAGTGLGMIASGIGMNKLAEKFPGAIDTDAKRMLAQVAVGLAVAKFGRRVLGPTMARAFLVGSAVPAVVELGSQAVSNMGIGSGGLGALPSSPMGGRRHLNLAIA